MTKHCSNCGASMPKDDARFCNTCGRPLALETVSSAALPDEQAATSEPRTRKPVLREQVAFHSFAPLPSLSQRKDTKGEQEPHGLKMQPTPQTGAESPAAASPDPQTHISANETSSQEQHIPEDAEHEEFSASTFPLKEGQPLPAKVWDQEDENDQALPPPAPSPEAADEPASAPMDIEDRPTLLIKPSPDLSAQKAIPSSKPAEDKTTSKDEAIEDRPTLLMPSSPGFATLPSEPVEDEPTFETEAEAIEDRPTTLLMNASSTPAASTCAEEASSSSASDEATDEEDRDAERFDTQLLSNTPGRSSAAPSPEDTNPPSEKTSPAPVPTFKAASPNVPSPLPGGPSTPIPPMRSGGPSTPIPPAQPLPPSQSSQAAFSRPSMPQQDQAGYRPASAPSALSGPALLASLSAAARARRFRTSPRILIAVALLAVVVIVGSLLVVSLTQSSTSDPWKSYSSSNLGFSTRYPVSWNEKSDSKKSQVQFSDDNQTVSFTVTVASTSNIDAKQFVHQQADKAALSDIQDVQPLSFSSMTWQVVQGNLSIEGVTYHVQLLAAQRGSRLYLVMQQAIKTTYDSNERIFFSQMRNSWQFA